ncbi:hypothetical protein BDN72DRAFT_438668 [Pluteus cervinus]|uniref:Uncharacterized protein n=1 Tax=Pluteus cervinus TaxID=181527 RepID=A0ACD3A6T1_9AGAR|nr:hypothetical protein BDN72DRAFT_438668 [Pluteus cervinus]
MTMMHPVYKRPLTQKELNVLRMGKAMNGGRTCYELPDPTLPESFVLRPLRPVAPLSPGAARSRSRPRVVSLPNYPMPSPRLPRTAFKPSSSPPPTAVATYSNITIVITEH